MSDQDSETVLGQTAEADQPQAGTEAPAADVSSLLANIKNANGEPKYKTLEDAIKGLQHSQEHISKLEAENAAKEEKLREAKAIDDVLGKLSAKSTPPAQPAGNSVDDASIAEIVRRELTAKETADQIKKNQAITTNALKEKYGNKWAEVFKSKASELGVSKEFLEDVAAKSPTAALEMFGLRAVAAGNVPNKLNSTVNVSNQPAPQPHNFRMNGASSADLINEWKRHKPQT